jgi:hypothetical protein
MNKDDYITILFNASWCPLSHECKPNFEKCHRLSFEAREFTGGGDDCHCMGLEVISICINRRIKGYWKDKLGQ